MKPLNLFYLEPDPDRWFKGDRYLRSLIRRIVRGPRRPGGQERVFLNLKAGLRKLGIPFRENDFAYAKKHPEEPVGIIGKPHVLDLMDWKNPILFGAAVMSHPLDDRKLLKRLPIKKILVPGPWMKRMCKPFWGKKVEKWPVGIDTDLWRPDLSEKKDYDFLIYEKVLWEHDRFEKELIEPIRSELRRQKLTFSEIRYGHYKEEDFFFLLKRCKAMVFLCEHETQGIAYQQALSMNIPILAWDRGGFWQDPSYYPRKVLYKPVSSVPYWDAKCGIKFKSTKEFGKKLRYFIQKSKNREFKPRKYVLQNLNLKKCAHRYLEHYSELVDQ